MSMCLYTHMYVTYMGFICVNPNHNHSSNRESQIKITCSNKKYDLNPAVLLLLLLLLQPFYGPLSGTTRVSWYQNKHLPTHLSWSSSNLYQLLPSTMIHSILPVQCMCLTIWPVRKENTVALQRAEMRMVGWMCDVKVRDKVLSKELRERLGIDDIILVVGTTAKQAVMVWACVWKEDTDWVNWWDNNNNNNNNVCASAWQSFCTTSCQVLSGLLLGLQTCISYSIHFFTAFSFLTGQVSLPCSILLHTQLLYSLPLPINDISLLVSNGTNCRNLFHPIQILASTAASASPSTLNISPK